MAPSDFPLLHSIRINGIVLSFCFATALLSGGFLAIAPAFVGTSADLITAVKQSSRSSLGRHRGSFQSTFAAVQIALSVALLMGAGLMIRSLVAVLRVDTGLQPQHVVTMQVFLSGPRYLVWRPDGVRIEHNVDRFFNQLLERVQAIPGVHGSAVVSWLPEVGYNTGNRERSFRIAAGPDDRHVAYFNAVSDGDNNSLRIPVLQGRPFLPEDAATAPWVVIVNRAFAARYFPGENAVGKQIVLTDSDGEKSRQIVGVVANVHQDSPEKSPEPEIFTPYLQQPPVAPGHGYQNRVHMSVVVNASGDLDSLAVSIRQIAAQLDSNQPVYGVRTMATVLSEMTALRRLFTTLLEMFAGFALFLCVISLYGIVSQTVTERTAEIGLRMALGATPIHVHRLLLLQSCRVVAYGLVGGLAISFWASRLLTSLLFGTSIYDPLTLTSVFGCLLAACLCAIWHPTRRAVRVDPNTALREE